MTKLEKLVFTFANNWVYIVYMPRPIEDAFVPIITDTICGALKYVRIPSMIVYYESFCCPCMSHLSAERCMGLWGVLGIFSSLAAAPKETHTHYQWLSITSGVPFDNFVHDDDISSYIGSN